MSVSDKILRRQFIRLCSGLTAGIGSPKLWLPPVVAGLSSHVLPKFDSSNAPISAIRFEEIAAKAGLHYVTANSPTQNKNQPETMVAGVALFDYDRDGFLDVYLVGGAAIPSLQKESPAYWNRLFHNNHDGTFTDVTERAGGGRSRLRNGRGSG